MKEMEQLQAPEFRQEYNALQPERAIIQGAINERKKAGLAEGQRIIPAI